MLVTENNTDKRIISLCPNCGIGRISEDGQPHHCPNCGHHATVQMGFASAKDRMIERNGGTYYESVKRIQAIQQGLPIKELHFPACLRREPFPEDPFDG